MFAGCLKAGAILVSADEESQQALYDFGIHLGIAFQLTDDNLDVYAEKEVFGKAIGGDIRDNKKTYLFLKALQLATDDQKKMLQQWFSTPTVNFEEKYSAVRKLFDSLGVREITDGEVLSYVQKALADLDRVKVNEEKKQALRALAMKLIHREK